MKSKVYVIGILLVVLVLGGCSTTIDQPINSDLINKTTEPENNNVNSVVNVNNNENNNQSPENKEANIKVFSPVANAKVYFPLKITGEARVFENTLAVEVKEKKSGAILFSNVIMADAPDAGLFGPFSEDVDFLTAKPINNEIILNVFWSSPKDGARLDEVSLPLIIDLGETINLSVYFADSNMGNNDCQANKVVSRIVPKTQSPARTALELLILGPTNDEREDKIISSINQAVVIQKLTIENKIAKVDFSKNLEEGVAGSCNVSFIRSQIEKTLLQFSTVKEVIISIDGRVDDILQP